jgi:hypothetical protein
VNEQHQSTDEPPMNGDADDHSQVEDLVRPDPVADEDRLAAGFRTSRATTQQA